MSDTLTREPLTTSLSFLAGHRVVEGPPADPSHQPLAYLYAEWDGEPSEPMGGHYDQDTQTWTFPPGTPTAGHNTNTSTTCYAGSDTCRDDVCE